MMGKKASGVPVTYIGTTRLVLFLGTQTLSLICSGVTAFALRLWIFDETVSALRMAQLVTCMQLPAVILGRWVARLPARFSSLTLAVAGDLVAITGTCLLAVTTMFGELDISIVFVSVSLLGVGDALQYPAYAALLAALGPASSYGRINGAMSLSRQSGLVLVPAVGGILVVCSELELILLLDILASLTAVITIVVALGSRIERKTVRVEDARHRGATETVDARTPRRVRRLLLHHSSLAVLAGSGGTLLAPLILSSTGNSYEALAAAEASLAAGALLSASVLTRRGVSTASDTPLYWLWGLAGFLLCVAATTRSPFVWCACGFAFSTVFVVVNVGLMTRLQIAAPASQHVKIFSAFQMLTAAGGISTALLMAYAADIATAAHVGEAHTNGLMSGPGAAYAAFVALAGIGTMTASAALSVSWQGITTPRSGRSE